MARVSDFINAVRQQGPIGFLKRLYHEITDDNVFTNAAAMSYAWVFAIMPFMIFALTLLPYVPDRFTTNAKDAINQLLYRSGLTWSTVDLVDKAIDGVMGGPHKGLLSIGLVLTLWAASRGMSTTMTALDEAFEVENPRSFFKKNLFAIALTLMMVTGGVVVMIALPVSGAAKNLFIRNLDRLPDRFHGFISVPALVAFDFARYVIGLTVMQFMIALLYHFGPTVKHRLRLFSPGAIFAALGWLVMGWVLSYYFSKFSDYSKTYGTVGGVLIMLLVFYVDGIIILIGAEIDSEAEKCQHHADGTVDCVDDHPAAAVAGT